MINWKSIKEFALNCLILFGMSTVGKMIVMFVLFLLGTFLGTLVSFFGEV